MGEFFFNIELRLNDSERRARRYNVPTLVRDIGLGRGIERAYMVDATATYSRDISLRNFLWSFENFLDKLQL